MGKNKKLPFLRKNVIIVGGSQGIGKATAIELAKLGANLCIVARKMDILSETKAELEKLKIKTDQKIDIISADATIEEQLRPALEQFIEKNGCHILIHCVGGSVFKKIYPNYVENYKLSDFEELMKFNYSSTLISLISALPHFMKEKKGHFVFLSSLVGLIGTMGYATYAPPKFAVSGLAECLRHELKPYNIKISVVYPSDVKTPGLEMEKEFQIEELKMLAELASVMEAEEVAKQIVKGILKNKFSITPGRSGIASWLKRHFPSLIFRIIDGDLKKARKQLGKK